MRHARHHEHAVKVAGIADCLGNLSVVIETILRSDGRIRPSCILDHLAPVLLERPQVGVHGTEDGLEALPRGVVLLYEVDGHCQLKRPWYARRVGGAAARVGELLCSPIIVPHSSREGPEEGALSPLS